MKQLFSILLIVAVVVVGAIAQAQQSKKVSRIGYVTVASRSTISARVEAFRQGMRDLGYVEDKNIVIEWRYGEGKQDRLTCARRRTCARQGRHHRHGGSDINP